MIENSKSNIEKEELFNELEFNNTAKDSAFKIIAQQSDSVYKKTLFYAENITTLNSMHIASTDTHYIDYLTHFDEETLKAFDALSQTRESIQREDLI